MLARSRTLLATSLLASSVLAPAAVEPPSRPAQSFEPNRGQADPSAAFVSRGNGYGLLLSPEGPAFSLPPASGSADSLRLRFPGAAAASLEGVEELPGKVHYLRGSDGGRRLADIPTYAAVTGRDLYPGVDVAYRGDLWSLELELAISTGAETTDLRLAADGADGIELEPSSGDVIVAKGGARLRLARPVAVQDIARVATAVPAEFVLRGGGEIGLHVPAIEAESPLRVRIAVSRIDPAGGAPDTVRAATDARGNVYVAGRGAPGAFVARLDAGSKAPVYTTYFGEEEDAPLAIAVDRDGEVLLGGRGRRDGFAVRLREDGAALVFSTRLGGEARGVALDEDGDAWVVGGSEGDAFVAELGRDGSFIAARRLGGSGDDFASAIRVDDAGSVVVAGTTTSTDFPVEHALQPALGGAGASRASDAFVAKLRPGTLRLVYATYLGGSGEDFATDLDVDASGNAYVVGRNGSVDFPRAQGSTGGPAPGSGFLVALARDGGRLLYTAGLGGASPDSGEAVAAGAAGVAFVAGRTEPPGTGTFVSTMDPDGRLLTRSSRERRAVARGGIDVAVGPDGQAVVAGTMTEEDPAAAPLEPARSGGLVYVLGGSSSAPLAAGCPGTVSFNNGAGTGLWQTPANWNLNRLPLATDDVCIGGTFAVTLSSGTQTINTLFVDTGASLTLSSGSVSMAAASTINGGFTLGGGTLTGAGTVTIASSFGWSGGTMTGAGIVNANGGIAISGAAAKVVSSSRVLNTAGATTWTGAGSVQVGTGASINNNGTWDAQSDAAMNNPFGGSAAFNNNNVPSQFFQKSGGAGITNVTIPFNNSGAVKILAGTLSLNAGSTSQGSITGSPGTTLQFGSGTHALLAGSSTSADSVVVATGTVNVDGLYAAVTGTTVSGGTASFNPAATVSSVGAALTVSSGTLNLTCGEAINPTTFSFSGGTLQGSDTVTVSGASTWTAGTMTGAGIVRWNGGGAISGTGTKIVSSSRVLETSGATTWTGTGAFQVGAGASISNNGTWDAQSDAAMNNPLGGTAAFNNNSGAGRFFQKSGGTGITNVAIPFNSAGATKILAGTLSFTNGSTHSGTLTGSPGTTLQLGSGTHAFLAGSSTSPDSLVVSTGTVNFDGLYAAVTGTTVSGGTASFNPAGTVSSVGAALTVSSGTLNLTSGEAVNVATLSLSGGTLQGSDTLTVSGASTWTAGTMTGAGIVQWNGGGAISGTGTKALSSSRVLSTAAVTTWTGAGLVQVGTGASINNGGTWDAQGDATMNNPFGGSAAFVNSGTFQKSAGAGTTAFAIPMTSSGAVQALAGTLSFTAPVSGFTQTAGTTTLNGGTITSATSMSVEGGVLRGIGNVSASVSNGGQVGPGLSPGILNETGTYTQAAGGSLAVEIGGLTAGTQYDRLAVTGAATLAGTLSATLVNGFVPASGDTFAVLTYASRTGTFATLSLPPLAAGWYWISSYGATSFTLTAVLDTDGDGMPNSGDCAPFDPGAFAVPLEVAGDALAADKQTLSWTSSVPSSGSATVHDVVRGVLRQFPVGSGAGETCLAAGIGASSTTDGATPAAGAGVYYLVRGRNVCGTGTYGFATGGAQRITSACP